MKRLLFCLSLILLLFSCKNKKTSLKDDSTVTVTDFIEFFPKVDLPYYVSDSVMLKKPNDSMVIGRNNFAKFIPDSIYRKEFGKGVTPKMYAIGRAEEKNKEKYLLIKAVQGSKRVAYLAVFDKKDKYLRAMPIIKMGIDRSTSAYGLLDSKYQITTYRETRKTAEDITFKRNVYFYDRNSDQFMLIMTEPNEEIIQDIINPIDTLVAKHKYAGDYVISKHNYISVRDGKNPSELQFFVHFEKLGGECNGELKGVARMISPTVAQYAKSDNPCVLEFTFTSAKVTMREKGGCGSFRDIKCFFEGSYFKKKKPAKTKAPKKK